MDNNEQIDFFMKLILLNYDLMIWKYDYDMTLIDCNSKYSHVFEEIMTSVDLSEEILRYAKENDQPLVFSIPLGLVWASVFETYDGEVKHIYVLGPIFIENVSREMIEASLRQYDITLTWKHKFVDILSDLPVIPISILYQYMIMFQFAVSNRKVKASDIQYIVKADSFDRSDDLPIPHADRRRTWAFEQELLENVRKGNLDYKNLLGEASNFSEGIRIDTRTPLRRAKNSVLVFISLCQRAAIEGGISPDTAYSVGDMYAQNLEAVSNLTEIVHISHTMYDDFIHRVHHIRSGQYKSKAIQRTVEYIESHINEQINMDMIAQYAGYSKYYLSRKFASEMGCTISSYINDLLVKKAKIILSTTDRSIQEISEGLHFSTRSYFSKLFKDSTGQTPGEYRDDHKIL